MAPRWRALLVALAVVAIGGVLPFAALQLARRSATEEVKARVMAGEHATATAVANDVGNSYRDTVGTLARAAGAPAVLQALTESDKSLAETFLGNMLAVFPLAAIRVADASGRVVAAVPSATGAPAPEILENGITEGPLRQVGPLSLRSVSVAFSDKTGSRSGYLVADVDVGRLIDGGATLRFGETGKSALIGIDGRVMIDGDPNGVGEYLKSAVNRRIARGHEAATLVTYSPFYGQDLVEAYVPVLDQPWGVLTAQTTAEAFASVHALGHQLQTLGTLFAVLGLGLAAAVGSLLWNRERRISAQTLALADANERMQRESRVDSLTGVANRGHLYDELGRISSLLARQGRPLAVLAVDVDHFKTVNDEYGHAVGDIVLLNVATALKESVRVHDVVGRTGGEEFVVLLPDTDGPSAAALAERMRLEVSRRSVPGLDGARLEVTVTIGCAAGSGIAAEALLRSADRALYTAKRAGRNQVQRAPEDSVAV